MPSRRSTASERSAPSASIRAVENPVSATVSDANATTAMRSSGRFVARKVRAAATASFSAPPLIERDVSIARTTLLALPRFSARSAETRVPFSRTTGAEREGDPVTIAARTAG